MFSDKQPLAPDFSQAGQLPLPSFPPREPDINQLQDQYDEDMNKVDTPAKPESVPVKVSPITCHGEVIRETTV